jgi:hypothetical protein
MSPATSGEAHSPDHEESGMDIHQYFKDRGDLILRVLSESPGDKLVAPAWRFFVAGMLCLAAAPAAQLWAASAQTDAGFFARISTLLALVLLTGTWLLTSAIASHFFLARTTVLSRDSVREKVLLQLLKIDGSIAHKQLRRAD